MNNLCLVEPCPAKGGGTCEFPFMYNDTQHIGCITHDNDETPWCDIGNKEKTNCGDFCPGNFMLTTAKHAQFVDSITMMMTKLCLVECRSAGYDPCAFPFNYHGEDFYKCIIQNGDPLCDTVNGWQKCDIDCPGSFFLAI